MRKYIALMLAAFSLFTSGVVAGTDTKKVVIEEEHCRFRDSEVQFDLFGAGGFYQNGRPGWGGGVGANVFFLRYLGIGVEQGLIGRNDSGSGSYAEWNTLGSLYLRYPICSWNVAPYAMAGGGAFYGTGQGRGVGHVGGGIEYRFTDRIGVFADARWLFTGNGNNNDSGALYGRTGLRVAF